MRVPVFIASFVLAIPFLASAAAFGFPDRPLWLSSTSAHEGEKITMYAAVYNASDAEMRGTVSFIADGETFDTKDISLPAGGSLLATSNWSAIKGSHSLSASFVSGTQKESTDKITVTVTDAPPAPPPEPTIVDKTLGTANDFVSDMTTSVPIVGTIADAIIEQTEKVRVVGGDFLEPYAKTPIEKQPLMNTATEPTLTDTALSYGKRGLQLAAAAALFAFDTRWLFYVLTLVLFYLLIRKMISWVNRPRF